MGLGFVDSTVWNSLGRNGKCVQKTVHGLGSGSLLILLLVASSILCW